MKLYFSRFKYDKFDRYKVNIFNWLNSNIFITHVTELQFYFLVRYYVFFDKYLYL